MLASTDAAVVLKSTSGDLDLTGLKEQFQGRVLEQWKS